MPEGALSEFRADSLDELDGDFELVRELERFAAVPGEYCDAVCVASEAASGL